MRDAKGAALVDEYDQCRLRHGDTEVRTHDAWPDPFALYPGEEAYEPQPMRVVRAHFAGVAFFFTRTHAHTLRSGRSV